MPTLRHSAVVETGGLLLVMATIALRSPLSGHGAEHRTGRRATRAPGSRGLPRAQRSGSPRRLLGRLLLGVSGRRGSAVDPPAAVDPRISVISPDLVALEILRLWLLVDGASTEWRGRNQLLVRGAAIELVGDRAHELGVRVHELTDRVVSQDPKAKAS